MSTTETNKEPLVVERTLNAPVARVWEALTDNSKMKEWYFDIADFKAEVGFEFNFTAGDDKKMFVHLCKVTSMIPNKQLSYTWRYEGHEGNSEVTFELFDEGDKTKVKITHTGLETFPAVKDFAKENFLMGWTHILGTDLKNYVEKA